MLNRSGITLIALAVTASVLLWTGPADLLAQTTQPATTQATAGEHPMKYRILWTWDSWICNPDSAASYVQEYKKLIDFMAQWDYNGLIIWGFVDDRHGGVEAAKEVASYGAKKGVRILPGIGAGGYEGYTITPNGPYNLTAFLKEHADLRAIPRGTDKPSPGFLCLYQPASVQWVRDGAKWLAETFEIGGVNIESNESGGIDNCPLAAEATRQEPNRLKYAASFSDMLQAVPPIYEEVRKKHPDAWITYATYQPPWWDRQEDAWLLKKLPADAIAQWNIELAPNNAKVLPPVKDNIALIHSGGWSYNLAPFPSRWAFTQYRCFYPNIAEVRKFSLNQLAAGVQGIVVGNVGSAEMPDNEIAYIAYLEFTRDPKMTVEAFSQKIIGKLYGEKAEPLVRQLMLAQPAAHQAAEPIWRPWAMLISAGNRWNKLPVAKPEVIEKLKGQIELARAAQAVATESGQQRLKTIIAVLEEYRIIAELSTKAEMATLIAGIDKMTEVERKVEYKKIVEILTAAGLPEGIYKYSKLAR